MPVEKWIGGQHVWVRYGEHGHVCAVAFNKAGVGTEALREVGMPVEHTTHSHYVWPKVGRRNRVLVAPEASRGRLERSGNGFLASRHVAGI